MPLDRSALPRQFRYWAFHCSFNALPSFIIACTLLGYWRHPQAIAAMLAAVLSFIVLYSFLTSLKSPLSDHSHPLHRAMKMGTKIRTIISLVSIPVVMLEGIMILPDFWCGYLAVLLVDLASASMGGTGTTIVTDPKIEEVVRFWPTFAITMVEGFILSFLLLMISFFALLVIHGRDRRKGRLMPEPGIAGDLPEHQSPTSTPSRP